MRERERMRERENERENEREREREAAIDALKTNRTDSAMSIADAGRASASWHGLAVPAAIKGLTGDPGPHGVPEQPAPPRAPLLTLAPFVRRGFAGLLFTDNGPRREGGREREREREKERERKREK